MSDGEGTTGENPLGLGLVFHNQEFHGRVVIRDTEERQGYDGNFEDIRSKAAGLAANGPVGHLLSLTAAHPQWLGQLMTAAE